MKFVEKAKLFLEKLQALPETKKKIILWTIVAILGLTMGYFWINNVIKTFSKITESSRIIANSSAPVVNKDQTINWKTYTNDKYGINIKYPDNWNVGVSILFPNMVLFCPPELASPDSDVICKMKQGVNHADTQAPIAFSLVQKKFQLADKNSAYEEIFKQMEKSLNSIK